MAASESALLKVAGVLLAAGSSRRFGEHPPKQLLEINGVPLVRLLAQRLIASTLDPVVAVLGHRAAEIQPHLLDLDLVIALHPHYARGQASSVAAGLVAAQSATSNQLQGALFLPTDQPFVDTALLDQLHCGFPGKQRIVVPKTEAGVSGAPVIFGATFFDQLQGLEKGSTPDAGGRQILKDHQDAVLPILVADERCLLDVDTRDEAEALGLL